MFQRAHLQQIKTRINEPRKFIQVIYGPRQVGKTTLVKQLTEQLKIPYLFFSADESYVEGRIWLNSQWEAARIKYNTSQAGELLLIVDEIQKIEEWSDTVKANWDKDTFNDINIKLIILGSSRLLLQKGLSDSLAGRYETVFMGHWSFSEMQEAFGLTAEQYVFFGSYPGAAFLMGDESRWKSYVRDALVEPSINKDILMLTRVDKPALLKRLFELGCLYSGQILSLSKILGQLHDAGNTTTLSHYLNLLDVAGLLGGIEKFSKEKIRQRSSSPKFQVHNMALFSCQLAGSFQEVQQDAELWGRMIESAIGMHLLNQKQTKKYELYYWRHKDDEVDFVMESGVGIIAIEVKSGKIKSLKGLDLFQRLFSPHKTLVVGKEAMPWQEFLKINPEELF